MCAPEVVNHRLFTPPEGSASLRKLENFSLIIVQRKVVPTFSLFSQTNWRCTSRNWKEQPNKRQTSGTQKKESFQENCSEVGTLAHKQAENSFCLCNKIKKTSLTTCLCYFPAPQKCFSRAQRHLHFHTFLHLGQNQRLCRSGEQEIYTLLFGNDVQTAAAEPQLLAGDVFYAFSSQRQM